MVCSTYIPKIFLSEEQLRISRGKLHFDEVKRSTRINPNIPPKFCKPHPYDCITTNEEDFESINSSYWMNIIGQNPNKFNMIFYDGDFESVNQESSANTSKNESNTNDLDVIPENIRCIKELMAHKNIMEYFITNNAENIINILTKHELLESYISTPLSLYSFFQYENAGSSKWRKSINKVKDVDVMNNCSHDAHVAKMELPIILEIELDEDHFEHDNDN